MSDQLFQRAVRDWLEDGSDRTPPTAIDAVLLAVKTTPQERDLRIPRRFNQMPTSMRLAAAVAVVAILGVGALAFMGQGSNFGGQPTPVPTPSPSPAVAPTPTQRAVPTATPIPPLTETFTSTLHGISVSYSTGWVPRAATEPWPAGEMVFQKSPFADVIEDGSFEDTAFLAVASQPLEGASVEAWAAEYLTFDEGVCARSGPVTVDGAPGVVSLDCSMAFVSAGGRGYLIWLYRIDDRSQFLAILGTVDLRPEDAIDPAPSPTA